MNTVVGTTKYETHFHGKTKIQIRRRRVCRHCGTGFYTREVVEPEKSEDAITIHPIEDEGGRELRARDRDKKQAPPENPYL